MVRNKIRLLLLLGIGSIGSLCAMGYEEVVDEQWSSPAPATAGPAAAAAAAEAVDFLDEPKILALDFDLTFLSVHCGGHPMAHLDTAISRVDLPRYVATLRDLHKHFSEVVIITRGIKTETEEFLRKKGLLRPGLIDRVYGARDQAELKLSGETYWPARKVTFLQELMKEKNVTSKASMYFYDDEKANVEMAGQKGFVNAYQAYADNPKAQGKPLYKRFRRGNGVALLQDILEDMETNCAICMASLSEEERFGNTACCKNDLLHKNCLEEWTMHKRKAECPLCRGIYKAGVQVRPFQAQRDHSVMYEYEEAGGPGMYELVQEYEVPLDDYAYALPPVAATHNAAQAHPIQARHNDREYGDGYEVVEDDLDTGERGYHYDHPVGPGMYESVQEYETPDDFDYAAPVVQATHNAAQAHPIQSRHNDREYGDGYEVVEDDFDYAAPVAASAAVQAQPTMRQMLTVMPGEHVVREEAEAAIGGYENIADISDEYQERRYTSEEQAFLDSIRSRTNALKQERDRKRAEDALAQARGRKAPVALPRVDRGRAVPAAAGEDSDLSRALELSRQDQQRFEQQAQREEDEIQEAIQRSLEETVGRRGRALSRTLGSTNTHSDL